MFEKWTRNKEKFLLRKIGLEEVVQWGGGGATIPGSIHERVDVVLKDIFSRHDGSGLVVELDD